MITVSAPRENNLFFPIEEFLWNFIKTRVQIQNIPLPTGISLLKHFSLPVKSSTMLLATVDIF
jgi:hypothetical protein